MSKQNNTFLFILLLLCLTELQSCTSSQTIVSASENSIVISKQADIWMLPPTLHYESIQTEATLSASDYQGAEVGNLLQNESKAALEQKGFQVYLKEKVVPIHNRQLDLFRPVIPEDLLAGLHTIGGSSSSLNILVLDLKVKVGEGGSWDAYSGAITSKNHYAKLRAILIDASEGKVLWRNEVQLRDLPKPGKKNFSQAIQTLFQTIK
jgi:hypothetical protein